jgi:acyl-CoA thioesterase
MTETGFDADTALAPAGEGSWEGEIVSGWETPRGPLGGYVMAILMRGLALAVGDTERQARSVTMHFLRVPEAGPVTVTAALEREGRSLSTVSGRLEQGGKLIGIALGAYSKPWEGPPLDNAPMPEVDTPDPVKAGVAGDDRGNAPRPEFLQRMVMQHRFGELPFTGADEGLVGGWVGLVEERPIDELAIAVLADAWFPAPWPRLAELAPAPTIDLTIHFRSPLPAAGPLLLGRFDSTYVRDGFFDENGQLWSPDGTLVAQSRQLGLLLGAKAP